MKRMDLRDYSSLPQENLRKIQRRIVFLLIVIGIGFCGILVRSWTLQINEGSFYQEQSENNRIREVFIQPRRGRIYDRNGNILVNNVPGFTLYLIPEDVKDHDYVIHKVSEVLGFPNEEIVKKIDQRQSSPYLPVKIRDGLTLKEVALFEEDQLNLAGLKIEVEYQRNYVFGRTASHVLGYVSEINEKQMESSVYDNLPPGTLIGQYGIEKRYDQYLRGEPGEKGIEVDALGHEIKILNVREPEGSKDLYLTIDLATQQAAEQGLGEEAGAIVAMEPETGDILAMTSHPAFDPQALSERISQKEWDLLLKDPFKPLNNRAIQGTYPPGSVFKILMSIAALEANKLDPQQGVSCQGALPFGKRVFRDWKRGGHGIVDLHRSLVESCDVYFYKLGEELGIDLIADEAHRFGLGHATGIDLPSEKEGIIPSTEWKLKTRNEQWFPGETLSVSIGQGYVNFTPLQAAYMMSQVANGGYRYKPRLLKETYDRQNERKETFPPVLLESHEISSRTLKIVREALRGVVHEPHGTAGGAKSEFFETAGKTGTAQVIAAKAGVGGNLNSKTLPKLLQDHAWFVAYAPYDHPKIVVAVLVEHGGHGGSTAAPLAKKVFEAYLNKPKEGGEQTLKKS
ncbi:MAG: penicillin-binding protein 2 [Nitrospirae bacterium]|nr:penicillin-binding protein 2 [Nitrospirota bacterium]MBI3594766.1 penicillin-binding protein 2 [Nitrospirota bacterium]